jgi:hypothetical protein
MRASEDKDTIGDRVMTLLRVRKPLSAAALAEQFGKPTAIIESILRDFEGRGTARRVAPGKPPALTEWLRGKTGA